MTERKVEIEKAVRFGWDTVKKDFWYFVGLALVVGILGSIGNIHHKSPNPWTIIGMFVTAWTTAGYLKLTLSYFDGKKLPFGDLFTQFKYYWRILGATILVALIIIGGLFLLVIPGIYWALKYQYTLVLIIDKDLGISEAMGESARLTDGVKLRLLGLCFTYLGVIIVGAIVLGVGILVAMPIVWMASIFVYRSLLKTTSAKN